jgi:hypothetical protein
MSTELRIEVFEPDADDEAVDELTRNLQAELLELDVDSVTPAAAGPAPTDSKGLELAAIGALLVQVKGSVEVVRSVVTTVRSWLGRGRAANRSLKITVDGRTLELSAATAEQQDQLVNEFIQSLAH